MKLEFFLGYASTPPVFSTLNFRLGRKHPEDNIMITFFFLKMFMLFGLAIPVFLNVFLSCVQ